MHYSSCGKNCRRKNKGKKEVFYETQNITIRRSYHTGCSSAVIFLREDDVKFRIRRRYNDVGRSRQHLGIRFGRAFLFRSIQFCSSRIKCVPSFFNSNVIQNHIQSTAKVELGQHEAKFCRCTVKLKAGGFVQLDCCCKTAGAE